MSEPIVLLLLRVPVQLINVITTVVGTLFYAPSYIMFLLIQGIVFGRWVKLSLGSYLMTWPVRFLLLMVSFTLFLGQFAYLMHYGVKHVDQSSWYILAASLAISIPGIIYLMRRGYLKALRYFKVPQLKSPKEYTVELLELIADLPSVVLTLLNFLLLKNAFKTFDFEYSPDSRRYLQHIAKLTSSAFFYDLERIFVWYLKVFPWRINVSEDLKKQKDHSMHRLAILFLLTVATIIDSILFVLLGWVPFFSLHCSHRRYLKLLRYGNVEHYRKYILSYSILTLGEYLQFICLLLSTCMIINAKTAVFYMKKSRQWSNILNEIYPEGELWGARLKKNSSLMDMGEVEMIGRSVMLVLLTLLQILLFSFRVVVFVSMYKEKKLKRFLLKREQNKQKQFEAREKSRKQHQSNYQIREYKAKEQQHNLAGISIDFQYQWQVPVYAFEFAVDLLFVPIVVLTALLRPWYFTSYFKVLDEEYNFKRGLILKRLLKAIIFYFCVAITLVTLPLYVHRLRWLVNYWNTVELSEEQQKFKFQHVFVQLMRQIFSDLPHLPLYYCMMASGTYLFRSKEQPKELLDFSKLAVNYNDYMHQVVAIAYVFKATISGKYGRFQEIYNEDREKYIKSVYDKRVFWQTVSAINRMEAMTKIMRLLIVVTRYRRSSYQRKVARIMAEPDLYLGTNHATSQIGLTLLRAKSTLRLTIEMCIAITIEIIVGLVVVFVLIPLTTWRFPTFVFLYRDERRYREITGDPESTRPQNRILKLVGFVLKLQLIDLIVSPMYILAFLACPLRFLKYCWREAYNYSEQNYEHTFQDNLRLGRGYFASVIFKESMDNCLSVLEAMGVLLTVVRIYYCYKLIRKAQHNFRKYFSKVLGLNQDMTFKEYLETRAASIVKPGSEKISLKKCIRVSFVEAIKDIPFAILIVVMFVLFPWRFHYIWNIVKIQHERMPIIVRGGRINVGGRRKDILRLMWSILKTDFVCIIMNTILLLSIYKTRRGIELGMKNIRRNLIQGFLSYDYRRQLICEMLLIAEDFYNVLHLLLLVFLVVRIRPTIRRMLQLHKQHKQKRKLEAYNKFIYETTLKAGKEEQLTNIGFFAFSQICSYLEPNDLHNLQKASQGLYTWTTDEEIWQEQWQRKYKDLSKEPNQPLTYRKLCINAYCEQSHPKKVELTYRDILREEIEKSLHEPITIFDYFSPEQLMYPRWVPEHGYIAGQEVYNEVQIVAKYIFVVPCQLMMPIFIRCFANEERRIAKQGVLFLFILGLIFLYIGIIYNLLPWIFCIDKFIALKLLLIAYLISFHVLMVVRIGNLRRQTVPGLYPYDFFQVLGGYITRSADKVQEYFIRIAKWVALKAVAVKEWIVRVGTPFYLFFCRICKSISDFVVLLVTKIWEAIMLLFTSIWKVFTFIKDVILGLGLGYLQLLANLMRYFLKFGRLGDLVFTPIALAYLTLPLILCYYFYWKVVAIIPAGILTTVLCLRGYKVLQSAQR